MTLRTLSREDLPAVAAVHLAAFPLMVVSLRDGRSGGV
jgi:hypothetical protein